MQLLQNLKEERSYAFNYLFLPDICINRIIIFKKFIRIENPNYVVEK